MSACTEIPVVVIHRDPLIRACLAAALVGAPALVVRAVVQDAAELDDALACAQGGLIISDHSTALLLAGSAASRLRVAPAEPRIAVVSSCDREWDLRSALEGRVRGYLSPGFDTQQLVDCVSAVHAGGRYLCPRAAARLAESLSYDALTERETHVLQLVVRGLPNKSIGRELDISVGTVKSHLKSAYAKLEVGSRTQAIAEAQRRGLLARTPEPVGARPSGRPASLHAVAPAPRCVRPHAVVARELCAA